MLKSSALLQLAVLDGWRIEGYNRIDGFSIGDLGDGSDEEKIVSGVLREWRKRLAVRMDKKNEKCSGDAHAGVFE